MPLCIYKTRFEKTGHKNAETPDFSGVSGECIYFGHSRWRSGRDSNPRAAFDDNTISSRARYDLFDTTAYSLSADRQRRLLYQNLDRCQDIFFAFARLYLAFTYIYAWKIANPHFPLLPGMTETGLSMRCGARADSPRPARETRLLFSDFQCFFLMPPSALPCDQRKASGKRRAEAESP